MKNYPRYIKGKRRGLKLTQMEFAEKLGVSFATVNRWENGHYEPSPLALRVIKALKKV
jgi:DNA-binding transcriptional regulator YiaG